MRVYLLSFMVMQWNQLICMQIWLNYHKIYLSFDVSGACTRFALQMELASKSNGMVLLKMITLKSSSLVSTGLKRMLEEKESLFVLLRKKWKHIWLKYSETDVFNN